MYTHSLTHIQSGGEKKEQITDRVHWTVARRSCKFLKRWPLTFSPRLTDRCSLRAIDSKPNRAAPRAGASLVLTVFSLIKKLCASGFFFFFFCLRSVCVGVKICQTGPLNSTFVYVCTALWGKDTTSGPITAHTHTHTHQSLEQLRLHMTSQCNGSFFC